MKILKTGLLTLAILAAGGLGALLSPVAHGQDLTTRDRVAPRALELLAGRGSEIGVTIRDVAAADAKGAQGAERGVLVDAVAEDSPAARAGIKKDDVIVEFDGERVRSARQFTRIVSETPAGRQITAALMRDGKRMTVSVEPSAGAGARFFELPDLRAFSGDLARRLPVPPAPPAPSAPPAPPAPPALPDFGTWVWRTGNTLGVTVQDLSDQLAGYFGAKGGVLVTSVNEGSAAGKAGLKAGDVITAINGSSIDSSSDLRQRLQRMASNDDFTLDVLRDRKTVTLKGKLEDQRTRRTFRSNA